MSEQRESSRESDVRRFDDGVAFGRESAVHHLDDPAPLFERGQKPPVPCPQAVAQHIGSAFAGSVAPDRIDFAEKLFVAHLCRVRAPKAVAQFGQSLTTANPQLVETQSTNSAELFKTDRHNSLFHDFDDSDRRIPTQPFGALEQRVIEPVKVT